MHIEHARQQAKKSPHITEKHDATTSNSGIPPDRSGLEHLDQDNQRFLANLNHPAS
jgi:hypothetical protein